MLKTFVDKLHPGRRGSAYRDESEPADRGLLSPAAAIVRLGRSKSTPNGLRLDFGVERLPDDPESDDLDNHRGEPLYEEWHSLREPIPVPTPKRDATVPPVPAQTIPCSFFYTTPGDMGELEDLPLSPTARLSSLWGSVPHNYEINTVSTPVQG